MHGSKVSLSKHSSNPQLLRVYICSHQMVPRWYLHHRLELTTNTVPLWKQNTVNTNIVPLASNIWQLHQESQTLCVCLWCLCCLLVHYWQSAMLAPQPFVLPFLQ